MSVAELDIYDAPIAAVEPLAVPSSQVPALIGWPRISAGTLSKLKHANKWPPTFMVGGRSFTLLSDIRAFILARKIEGASDPTRRMFSEKCRKAGQASAAKRRHAFAVVEAIENADAPKRAAPTKEAALPASS